MSDTRLVDLSHAAMGAVVMGVPISAAYKTKAETIRSGGMAVGDPRVDRGPWDITCNMAGEDPFSIPLVAALAGTTVAVAASGRIEGTATYQEFTVAHATPISMSIDLADRKSGTVQYGFRNRGAAGAGLADELTVAAGSARAAAARGRAIAFAAEGATFTPDGGTALDLTGLLGFRWSASADVQAEADTGSLVIDRVDVAEAWNITGSLSFRENVIVESSGLMLVDHLATLGQGVLVFPVLQQGALSEGTPPVNKVCTVKRVLFTGSSGDLGSRKFADASVDFECVMSKILTDTPTLAQMLAFADAA